METKIASIESRLPNNSEESTLQTSPIELEEIKASIKLVDVKINPLSSNATQSKETTRPLNELKNNGSQLGRSKISSRSNKLKVTNKFKYKNRCNEQWYRK